jgi:hypothetical protein
MREYGAPTSPDAGRGAALGVAISALAGFLSWCAVFGINLLVLQQDQTFSTQLLAAARYDGQTP